MPDRESTLERILHGDCQCGNATELSDCRSCTEDVLRAERIAERQRCAAVARKLNLRMDGTAESIAQAIEAGE